MEETGEISSKSRASSYCKRDLFDEPKPTISRDITKMLESNQLLRTVWHGNAVVFIIYIKDIKVFINPIFLFVLEQFSLFCSWFLYSLIESERMAIEVIGI